MDRYDAIVVGAGNSGLTAALELINNGLKTLIIEKNNYPGGCATSFVRGRFEIEPSLHELCCLGDEKNKGSVKTLFDDFDVDCDWTLIPDCFRAIGSYSDGSPFDVIMPNGRDAFISRMEEYVPCSRDKMNLLFSVMDEIKNGLNYISENKKYSLIHLIKNYPRLLTLGSYSVSKVFKALDLPIKCQEILSIYWIYLGVEVEHLSFLHYALMINEYISNPIYIPKHRSHYLSSLLLKSYQDKGGEIWLGVKAEEFLFNTKKCIGVRTDQGDVYAPLVFPDINQDIIYGRLMSKDIVPIRHKKLFNARKDQYSGVFCTAYFCLDVDKDTLGFKDYSIFFSDKSRKNNNPYFFEDSVVFLCYNVADPEFSPKGTCICSFTASANTSFFEALDEKDYHSVKTAIGNSFINLLKEKLNFDITGHIEEVEIATPWTFAQYISNPKGSVYGHSVKDWDNIVARVLNQDEDYTVPGIYPIGADAAKGDGYSSTYLTGREITQYALNRMKDNE